MLLLAAVVPNESSICLLFSVSVWGSFPFHSFVVQLQMLLAAVVPNESSICLLFSVSVWGSFPFHSFVVHLQMLVWQCFCIIMVLLNDEVIEPDTLCEFFSLSDHRISVKSAYNH